VYSPYMVKSTNPLDQKQNDVFLVVYQVYELSTTKQYTPAMPDKIP